MKTHLGSALFAVAIILSTLILGGAYKNRNKASNSIQVTGLGTKDFVSDLIVWNGSFVRKSMVLKEAYAELDRDREDIKKYLVVKGINDSQIVFSAVSIDKDFNDVYNNAGNRISSAFAGYRLTQNIQIESKEVNKIEDISRQVSELINAGIEFYSTAPQYYYTKLAALKIEMIANATKDANMRASKIAKNAGSTVGQLKNANMGVFQIVAQNSSEEYLYGGSFNTDSKRKTASITVKLEYETE